MMCLVGLLVPVGVIMGLVVLATPPHRRESLVRTMARGCLAFGLVALAIICVGAGLIVVGSR